MYEFVYEFPIFIFLQLDTPGLLTAFTVLDVVTFPTLELPVSVWLPFVSMLISYFATHIPDNCESHPPKFMSVSNAGCTI